MSFKKESDFLQSQTFNKIKFSLLKSKKIDQTENIEEATEAFKLEEALPYEWNPEECSFLWGTWIWEQASSEQRRFLNQLYWVAYYSQIISAEIATIYFNQLSAASLYGIEDFKIVCDTLDLESTQERTHINAFKKVSEDFEEKYFGKRLFTFPMRTPFVKTMLYSDLNSINSWLRTLQLQLYGGLLSKSAFLGCQYFTVRGLRTLNGKIVQHRLSKFHKLQGEEQSSIPSKISHYHFLDESFHFNTSTTISHDLINNLKSPTRFEKWVSNKAIEGCQGDHYNFSSSMNGIFWYEPDLFQTIFEALKSPVFSLNALEATEAMEKSLCFESEGAHESFKTHQEAMSSYKEYLYDFKYVNVYNKKMSLMSQNSMSKHLETNKQEFRKFLKRVHK